MLAALNRAGSLKNVPLQRNNGEAGAEGAGLTASLRVYLFNMEPERYFADVNRVQRAPNAKNAPIKM